MFAPGTAIYTTDIGGAYCGFSETSAASPLCAGVAALLKSMNPGMSPSEIKSRILNNVDKGTDLNPPNVLNGYCSTNGRLNALKALTNGVIPFSIADIPGVSIPKLGATPVSEIIPTDQFTGSVTWSPSVAPGGIPVRSIPGTEEYTGTVTWCHGTNIAFENNISYTAEIILVPKPGYTTYSLPANFFSVYGTSTSNSANSGKITAVFPPVP